MGFGEIIARWQPVNEENLSLKEVKFKLFYFLFNAQNEGSAFSCPLYLSTYASNSSFSVPGSAGAGEWSSVEG